jgi:tetratricopeptide (TPR) repeat protein
MPDSFDDARACLRSGRLADAERLLREIVARQPERAEALALLGASLGAQGRHEDAIAWLDAALARKPESAELLHNRAIALLALDRPLEASADLKRALGLRPDFPAALTALAKAHTSLGNALRVKGLFAEALPHYAEAVRLAPNLVEALSNHAAALQQTPRYAEALPLLERALAIEPRSALIASNLGISYFQANRLAEAERCQRLAIELDPRLDAARINLGIVLAAQDRTGEARMLFEQVARDDPANADAQSNLGMVLQEQGEVDAAIVACERALAARPDDPEALNNMGFVLQEEGRRREAIGYYRRALAANPHLSRAEYNLGVVELAEHEWREGWRHAEARFAVVPPVALAREFAIPRLREDEIGRTGRLAIWSEQGVGDKILYATMLPDLARRGVEFVVETDSRIIPALRRLHGWDMAATGEEAAFGSCDRHIPVGSLGALLRTEDHAFEAQPRALLAADPARVESMRKALHSPGRRLVGISWRSFQPKGRGFLQRRKSASLADFLPLSMRDDVVLLDLQYGETQAERESFEAQGGRLRRVPGLDLFGDIDGVLAAIEACDLVITTSNATAHFAGALGKETWVVYLGAVPPFHYWAPDSRGRCLWYPCVRIVTAPELRAWPGLFGRVARSLA